jgi:hypothetical protein
MSETTPQRELQQQVLEQLQQRHQNEAQQAQQLQQAHQFRQQNTHNKTLAVQAMQQMMSGGGMSAQSWSKFESWVHEQARVGRTAKLKRGSSAGEELASTAAIFPRKRVKVKRSK